MPFRFKGTESVGDGARRIATEQLDAAIASLAGSAENSDVVVHDVRRRCKRARALVRLVRSSLQDCDEHDTWLRDTAALLSHARDAAVLPTTHAIVAADGDLAARRADSASVLELLLRQFGVAAGLPLDMQGATLETVRSRMLKARRTVDGWCLDATGFAAIGNGLQTTYARSRNAMRKAKRSSSSADCHRWRKRVKYHAFHIQLIRGLWPRAMGARVAAAERLGELLGQVHDLAVYRAAIDAALAEGSARHGLEAFRDAAGRLGEDLLAQCWPLGQRLFALTPTTFAAEQGVYWEAWQAGRRSPRPVAEARTGAVSRAARRSGR